MNAHVFLHLAKLVAVLSAAGIDSPAELCVDDRQYNSLDTQYCPADTIYG